MKSYIKICTGDQEREICLFESHHPHTLLIIQIKQSRVVKIQLSYLVLTPKWQFKPFMIRDFGGFL